MVLPNQTVTFLSQSAMANVCLSRMGGRDTRVRVLRGATAAGFLPPRAWGISQFRACWQDPPKKPSTPSPLQPTLPLRP